MQRDQPYLSLLADTTYEPIFIIGQPRSGTTLLYNLLVRSGNLNYLSAYQVIHYHELLYNRMNGLEDSCKASLAQQFKDKGLSDRGIDTIGVTPDSPEEYSWVLQETKMNLLQMMLKPYGGPFSKRLQRHMQINADTLSLFTELCQKVQYLAGNANPLLLKNPADVNNFHEIRHFFPGVKLIFLHRNPIRVLDSWLRVVRGMMKTKNEYYAMVNSDYAPLFQDGWGGRPFLNRFRRWYWIESKAGLPTGSATIVSNANHLIDRISALPAEDFIELRYEDLCTDPEGEINRIFSFLCLPNPRDVSYADISPRDRGLQPDVSAHAQKVREQTQRYCARYGYAESPDAGSPVSLAH